MPSSSSNVISGGRARRTFFLRFFMASSTPYFTPFFTAAEAMALPAIKSRGTKPPRWRRCRRRRRRRRWHPMLVNGLPGGLLFYIGSHDTAVERFTRVLFALPTLHLGSSFSANLFGSFLLTLPDGFGGLMGRLENTRDESRRHAASLRGSSTASAASLASRHLDSGRARTSPGFFKPCWG